MPFVRTGNVIDVTIVDGDSVGIARVLPKFLVPDSEEVCARALPKFLVPDSEEVCAKLVLFGRAVNVVGFERVVKELTTAVD